MLERRFNPPQPSTIHVLRVTSNKLLLNQPSLR